MGTSNASNFVSKYDAVFNETVARYDSIKSDPTNGTASNRLQYSKNGGAFAGNNPYTNSTTSSDSAQNLCLGNTFTGGALPYNGWMGEIIIYDSILSAGNITSVQTYISAKWGI